jgi:hypothetical protein
MTWRLHIERTVAKALRTYKWALSTNIKLTLYKALARSVKTSACPIWEYAADVHLFKVQRLQNRVLRAIGNHDRRTQVREMHVSFKIPCVCDYITEVCSTPAKVILNHRNPIWQGEALHRKYKRLKLGGGQAYDRSADWLSQFRSG